jgi:hypothetical protein
MHKINKSIFQKLIIIVASIVIATPILNASSALTSGVGAGSGSTESYAKVGMAGGQFLKIAHGARGNAMAGAVSAITNDLASVF